MKSIITAMGNPTLNNELKKYIEYDIEDDDLFYQDAVLDILNTKTVDVLTLSGVLQGQWELYEFIDKIREIDSSMRIIIVMDEINSDIKCELLQREINDIFLDETVEISDIIEAINREEPIRKRAETNKIAVKEQVVAYNTEKEEKIIVKECQKQEVIVVTGTNGSGKSTIVCNLAKKLSSKTAARILVIDLDTIAGNLDELFDINKVPQNIELELDLDKKCGLNYAADLIKKSRFDTNVFDEVVIHDENIDILTGNTSLYFCQEVLCEEIYEKVLECAKEKYDFIIIDTSSNIFLDSTRWSLQKATKIFFVTENNYLSTKKSMQLLDVIVKKWGIWKEKISMIINKESSKGLEYEFMQKIFEDYKMIGKIRMMEENEEIPYEKILSTINFIPKITIKEKINNIKNNIKIVIDKNVSRKLLNKKEEMAKC